MSGGDKLGEHGLLRGWRMPVGELAGRCEGINEIGRDDQVAEPERGEVDLAEGAHVDDVLFGVQSLKRLERASRVTVLGIVVVFDHPRPRTPRPPEQFQSAGEAHRYAERVLMRRRHARQTRFRLAFYTRRDDQSFFIDGNGYEAGAGPGEGTAGAHVSGVLDPDCVTGVEEHARCEVKGLLRAGDHYDLLRLAPHGPRRSEVGRDLPPQRPVPRRVPVTKQRSRRPPPHVARDPAPHPIRKLVERRHARPECSRSPYVSDRGRRGRRKQGSTPAESPPGAWGTGLDRRGPDAEQLLWQGAGDVGARTDLSFQIPFGEQVLESRHHGRAGYTELGGERTRRGQPLSGTETAGKDARPQLLVELAVDRHHRRNVK